MGLNNVAALHQRLQESRRNFSLQQRLREILPVLHNFVKAPLFSNNISPESRKVKYKSVRYTGMWPIVLNFLRVNAPFITLPFAVLVGVIGYNVEGWISDKSTPANMKSIEETREERLLEAVDSVGVKAVDTLKDHKFVPRSIFEKNVSPSLQKTKEH